MITPTEEAEQIAVVNYCNLKGYPVFHVPNSTWTKSIQIKVRNKRLGVSSGVPDLFAIVNNRLIAIEMKRVKGSATSTTQKEWIERLNAAGVPSRVCKGFDEAVAFIEGTYARET